MKIGYIFLCMILSFLFIKITFCSDKKELVQTGPNCTLCSQKKDSFLDDSLRILIVNEVFSRSYISIIERSLRLCINLHANDRVSEIKSDEELKKRCEAWIDECLSSNSSFYKIDYRK